MDPDLYYPVGIAICFFGTSYFSLTETSLTSLSQVQAEQLASRDGFFNRAIRRWIQHPSRLLTSILVGSTACNTLAAVFATNWTHEHLQNVSLTVVSIVLTLLVLVFGEIAPKTVARAHAQPIAPYACRILLLFDFVCYPLTYIFISFVSTIVRAFGITMRDKRLVTYADLEYMVSLAGRQGTIEMDKSKILSSIFQFSKRRVKDIMIPRDKISAISVDANLVEVLDFVRQENHSRYPVYNQTLDRIVGFFHARDLFGILRSHGFAQGAPSSLGHFSLRTCLRRAFFVSEHSMISRVMNEMKTNRIHLAIVKDEWGNVVGLVTLEDILEEVFGEIEDEHDEHAGKPVVDLYSAGVEVEGTELLVDLKSKFGIEIEPTESYSTVNGFLMHYASHQQLTAKTVVIWKNYVFSISSVKDGEIEKVRITEIPEDQKED
jgi:putative hemolysin